MSDRHLTAADRLVSFLDTGLRTMAGRPRGSGRSDPAGSVSEGALHPADRARAGRLMRVNHVGEVCAQALYQGQSLTARSPYVRDTLARAAEEENDHLRWCEGRLMALGARKSLLNPLWYAGSLAIGAAAGALGDRANLGFLAETERQVVRHLDGHLERLPSDDHRSRAVVHRMREDERAHATSALRAGGAELPAPVRDLMRRAAGVMTRVAYWI